MIFCEAVLHWRRDPDDERRKSAHAIRMQQR
jgi:hypothetical protein